MGAILAREESARLLPSRQEKRMGLERRALKDEALVFRTMRAGAQHSDAGTDDEDKEGGDE